MLVAIIDLGTNTFNLLIAEFLAGEDREGSDKGFRIICNDKFSVKLGKGGINHNLLLPEAIERGLAALRTCLKIIKKYKADKTFAFATSAIREAINAEDFLTQAAELGIPVSVVSGDQEAELIYKGVQQALDIGKRPVLIMDIGGGSTEFIIADCSKIYWKKSFLLGVTRLIEKFKPSDPHTASEEQQQKDYLRNELQPLFEAVRSFPVVELIGSSGSFDSFADIIEQRFHALESPRKGTEYLFDLKEAELVFQDLLRSDRAQRLNTKGLIEMRVDLIVMAVVLTRFVLSELGLTKMRLSAFALKEGVLSQIRNEIQKES